MRASPARSGRVRAGVALAGAVLLCAPWLTACSSETSYDPPTASASADGGRARLAATAVSRLEAALRDRDDAAASAVGSGAAAQVLAAAARNVGPLRIDPLALRFVEVTTLEPDALAAFGPDAWQGTVEVRYRYAGWDQGEVRVESPVVFVPGAGGALVAAVGGPGGRTPLWLRGPVTVRETGRALVVMRTGAAQNAQNAARYVALARRALADVARVLPGWDGRLVLEIPASEEELDEALDATQEQYANIAAVTAAVDGSASPDAPVHVFLNPRVFGGLGPRGAQVVVSHESTHVATRATFASMPIWLLEGFADYVALANAGIPVRTAASQILARVRRQGPPDHLPTAEDLAPTATGLGATYEEAWLATRYIAERYGESELVAFYRAVDGGLSVSDAFTDVLGTTEAAFVTSWSADVRALAGGEPG